MTLYLLYLWLVYSQSPLMIKRELDTTELLKIPITLRNCCLLKDSYIAIIAIPALKMSEIFKVNFLL